MSAAHDPAPDGVDAITRQVRRLSFPELVGLLQELAGLRCVEGTGWRVRPPRERRERFPQRNAEIRRRRAEGQTLGMLALRFGLSRGQLWKICAAKSVSPTQEKRGATA